MHLTVIGVLFYLKSLSKEMSFGGGGGGDQSLGGGGGEIRVWGGGGISQAPPPLCMKHWIVKFWDVYLHNM